MIKTKKVKLTKKELFLILVIRYFKKDWWLFALIWVLAIFLVATGSKNDYEIFAIAFAILFPLLMLAFFWRYVVSKDNKVMFLERYYEIDSEKINGIIDNETFSLIKLEHFIKTDIIRKNYLLYVAKEQFIYIPIDAFESNADKEWFEKEIINKIKK